MPVVDLSQIGLEGQQAFYTRMNTAANTAALNANTTAQQIENEEAEKMQGLNAEASARLQSLAMGKRSAAGVDADSAAATMNSMADPMEIVAEVYAKGGAPGKAMEIMKEAAAIRKQEADIEKGTLEQQKLRFENILKGADLTARTIGVARNQDEWDFGIDQLEKQGVIESEFIEQLRKIPYSPNAAAYLREQAISSADLAKNELAASRDSSNERYRNAALDNSRRVTEIAEARHRESVRHNVALEKAGGKGAGKGNTGGTGAPSGVEVNQAKAALLNSSFKGTNVKGTALSDASIYIASTAKSILRENKTITWDTAIQQAILRAQQSGAIGAEGGSDGFLGFGAENPKAKFDRDRLPVDGLTPDAAAPMPKAKAEMKKGAYYITPQGVGKWNGSGLEIVE
jgi:hypothetical protein